MKLKCVFLQSPVSRQDSFEEGKSAPIATPERSKSSSGETLEKIKEEIEVVKTADENPCTTESSTTSSLPPTSTILTTTSRLILQFKFFECSGSVRTQTYRF